MKNQVAVLAHYKELASHMHKRVYMVTGTVKIKQFVNVLGRILKAAHGNDVQFHVYWCLTAKGVAFHIAADKYVIRTIEAYVRSQAGTVTAASVAEVLSTRSNKALYETFRDTDSSRISVKGHRSIGGNRLTHEAK